MTSKEVFEITGAEGKPITGDYTFKSNTTHVPTIIFIHGFKGFKDWEHIM
jgi:hypothetical protein